MQKLKQMVIQWRNAILLGALTEHGENVPNYHYDDLLKAIAHYGNGT